MLDDVTLKRILSFQKDEITAYVTYSSFCRTASPANRRVFSMFAKDELSHYKKFKKYTKKDVAHDKFKVFIYVVACKIFGFTFALQLMEKDEYGVQLDYAKMKKVIPEVKKMILDENRHEKKFIKMIEEEKLNYISSMVLGLNDALVELTGALAGFTFALQNTKVIGMAGLITGIAATFSMSAAEYMSQKHDPKGLNPPKAAMYTGSMYLTVVAILILPYFILQSFYAAFIAAVTAVFLIVTGFSFFVSVVQAKSFRSVFVEMLVIVGGVILLSYAVGVLARNLLGIKI